MGSVQTELHKLGLNPAVTVGVTAELWPPPCPNSYIEVLTPVFRNVYIMPFFLLSFLKCCWEVVRQNLCDLRYSSFKKYGSPRLLKEGTELLKTAALEVWKFLLTHKMLEWERTQEFMLEMRKLGPQKIKGIAQGHSASYSRGWKQSENQSGEFSSIWHCLTVFFSNVNLFVNLALDGSIF